MKHSSNSGRDMTNAMPSTRREIMKQGLGLTLGSTAIGVAGLGASTSAQAWGPEYISMADWEIWDVIKSTSFGDLGKPIMKKSKSDFWYKLFFPIIAASPRVDKFSAYKGAYISWQNSNDAMTKRGYICLMRTNEITEDDYYLADFRLYHKKIPQGKDISSMDIRIKNYVQNISVRSDELRKLDTADDTPFKGLVKEIFEYWLGPSSRSYSFIMTLPVPIGGGIFTNTQFSFTDVIYHDNAETDHVIVDSGVYRSRIFSFTMQPLTPVNGQVLAPVRFEIEAHSGGGFRGNNWLSLQFLRIPDYATNNNYNRSLNIPYEQTLSQVPAVNADISRLRGFASEWQRENNLYWVNAQTAVATDSSLMCMEAAASMVFAYTSLPLAAQATAQTLSACACLLSSTFATTRPQAIFNAASIRLGADAVGGIKAILRILSASSATQYRTDDTKSIVEIYINVAKPLP